MQIRTLRQQVVELQKEVHERDSRLSKLRARQRTLEAELEETKVNSKKIVAK